MSRRCAVRCLYLRLDPAPELEFHLRQKAVSLDQPRHDLPLSSNVAVCPASHTILPPSVITASE